MVSSDHYDPPAGLSPSVADLVHRHRSAAAQPQGVIALRHFARRLLRLVLHRHRRLTVTGASLSGSRTVTRPLPTDARALDLRAAATAEPTSSSQDRSNNGRSLIGAFASVGTRRFIVHLSVKLKRWLRDNESGGTATPLTQEAIQTEAEEEEAAAAAEAEAEEEAAAAEEEVVVVAARVAPSAASCWRHSVWNC